MKAYLEIVELKNDVVTASGGQQECECFKAGNISENMYEDDC